MTRLFTYAAAVFVHSCRRASPRLRRTPARVMCDEGRVNRPLIAAASDRTVCATS
jgi:hypothetical protein